MSQKEKKKKAVGAEAHQIPNLVHKKYMFPFNKTLNVKLGKNRTLQLFDYAEVPKRIQRRNLLCMLV